MSVAYEAATIEKWKKTRPKENVEILRRIMEQDHWRVLVQIAFEAGRQWQSEHPAASLDFPDYEAPASSMERRLHAVEAAKTVLSDIANFLHNATEPVSTATANALASRMVEVWKPLEEVVAGSTP